MSQRRTARMSAATTGVATAAVVTAALSATSVYAQDVSAPAILQMFEARWRTIERRTPDIFMAGYGAVWTPPTGRAQGGQSVGYDVYDRFDLGSAGNHTFYGTETGLKRTVNELHSAGLNAYADLVWNHNASWDNDTPGFSQGGGYPGMRVDYPNDGSGDFHIKDWAGDYYGRLPGLIDIAHEKNHQYVRNPVPGFANNIPAGTPGAFFRTANVPDDANRRFYPDLQGPSVTVNGVTYHRWSSDAAAGDPVAENATGYLMRNTRWLVEEIGFDGFRLDATKHLIQYQDEFGNPVGNPDWVLEFFDVAVNAGTKQPLLDGSRKRVFSFGEYLDANVGLVQNSIKKDANANRDALDFALHYALKNNLTGDGTANDWRNIVNTTQDTGDDGLANNGSQGVAFDRSHDDGGAHLSNVANAYLLMRPGNAVVYFNAREFGAGRDFPKDGNGDALGGLYGNTLTTLVNIRNTHGRGNYAQRWIDQNTLVYERQNAAIAGYNNRSDGGYDERTVQSGFTPGVHLVELTGNAADATVDPFNDIADTVVVQPNGQITMRIPRNLNPNGVAHNKGYVIYGLQTPRGSVSVSNVAKTLAPETPTAATNGTARLTSVDVIKASSFDFTLNTTAVTLSDGWRDFDADGDNALLKVDGGRDVNGSGGVDFTSGDVVYGFEQFVTQRAPGAGSPSGNGVYRQTIDATQLAEGYHYLTARAFRRRTDGGPAVFTDFRKVVYVDRFRPDAAFVELKPYAGPDDVDIVVRSTDQTATGMHVFHNLGASRYTDAQLVAMAAGGQNAADANYDRDLFKYGIADMKDGNHVVTVVTFEPTYDPLLGYAGGGVNVQRFAGIPFANGAGLGLADLDHNNLYETGDVGLFTNLLANNNQSYNPAADLSADGLIDEADNVLNVPWLVSRSANAPAVSAATNLRLTRAMALDGTLHVPAGTLNVSGTIIPATPLTFTSSFNIAANETVTKTGGQALNVNAPQTHGANATLVVAEGAANINTNGGANLTVNAAGGAVNFSVTQNLKTLGVGAGSTVTITPAAAESTGKSLKVASLNLTGGKLDIRNNSVIVDWSGTDPYPSLLAGIVAGKNGFTWDGASGITSSDAAAGAEQALHAVAIGSAGAIFGLGATDTFLWAGQQVDATTWLIKYTYDGDANLDGVVDGADYGIIDNYVQFPGTGGYFNGDFNYDGAIDGADYGIIDNTVQLQGAPIFPWWASGASGAASMSSDLSVTAVPEPSACGFGIAAAAALLRRRRRRREPNRQDFTSPSRAL